MSIIHDKLQEMDEFQEVMEAYTRDTREARQAVQADRDRQVALLYPEARTFALMQADAISDTEKGEKALAALPRTLTLVTPDLQDPSRDHLYVGPHAVLSRNLQWNPIHRELSFVTSDSRQEISGHFVMTHNRLRAYGTVTVDGQAVAVIYEVAPQRFRMKVAKDAAYLSGQNASITWDPTSDRWNQTSWSADYEVGFTYGVNGEEVIGDEKLYSFLPKFDDIKTGRNWEPTPNTYTGYMSRNRRLTYELSSGVKPPSGAGAELFPYQLTCKLSEFGADFTGGMVVGGPGYQGTVYGVIGDWAGHGVAGLYHLGQGEQGAERLVAVHDRKLHASTTVAAHTMLDGDVLSWSGLDEVAAEEAGIPTEGYLTFSPDGEHVVESSFGATGVRVHPDTANGFVSRIAVPRLAESLRHSVALANPKASATHDLTELLNMSQFATNNKGEYLDHVQEASMEDFYKILQNKMDSDLRATFFHKDPPVLDPDLRAIAAVKGTKGSDPDAWFKSLSVPYTVTCLGKFSDDPYAKTLNTVRSGQWMTQITGGSDVMAAQAPLLYQRRYQEPSANKNIGWYLADQIANHAKYALNIDATTEAWIKEARDNNAGTPEQLAEMEKSIRALGDHAKQHKQYWAFAVYTATSRPSYLLMLETFIKLGGEVDGSEYSQRVQRTVALLNILDTTSYFSQEYGYLLQLFEFGTLLPQMADLAGGVGGFNFAVKTLLDEFVKKYLNSPDPALSEAAQQLREYGSQELVDRMLAILRTSAEVQYGLYNWSYVVQRYQASCARLLGGVPALVTNLGALAAAGMLMSFFLQGTADWNSLKDTQKAFVISSAVGIVAINTIKLIKRSVALVEIWTPSNGFWKNARMFFSPKLLTQAQRTATTGLRGYLLQEGGPKVPAGRIDFRQWWASRQATAAAGRRLLPVEANKTFIRRLFGKNLTLFMARSLAGALAIVGIVMSAIDLYNSDTSLEKAAHSLFITASCLELVAVIGAWAVSGSAVTVGGFLVSSIFSAVSVVGFVALALGAILLIILMSLPQPTPVEKFAKERADKFYMPYKAAIDTFRIYRPIGEPQRAGIAMFATGDQSHALHIASDGKVSQAAFDATGHTAFYISVDEYGRTQIGAPILNTEGKPCLQSLAVDDAGLVTSRDYAADDLAPEPKLLWYADMQGEGTYQESASGVKELKSAPFKLRSVFFVDNQKTTRWLASGGGTGWKTTTAESEAATVRLEMVATKPAELSMSDVSWLTVAHDEVTGPALQVPGSVPQEWTVTPALPSGLTFDPDEGTIAMATGVDVSPTPKQEYTLKVTNGVGSEETTFALEITAPDEAAVLAV
ncbi:Ig domain-containing protein [Streptomyces sp. NPDC057271]|uniref:Ig domain-containing protein n=1 Tax=unclassified Streptomyces TaxID=2593676 RepID=UPI0036347F65